MKKRVLITGVTGGMGKATAELFLGMGCHVYGIDVADECPLPISYFKADLRKIDEVKAAFDAISGETDSLSAIIHFAGIYRMASLAEIEEKDFEGIFDINLFGVYRVNKVFFPLLREGSKIIITSSELAPLYPLPFTGIYAVTKSAIEKYAYSLKMELQLLGINVSVIRPGAVKTGLLDVSMNELDRLCDRTKLYKTNTKRFKRIVGAVEARHIPPEKVARLAGKVYAKKKPAFVYSINRNPLLRLMNVLPKRLQLYVIKKLLKSK